MNLYTIVTNNEYELPIKCDIKAKEVAEFLNISIGNVRQIVYKPRKRSQYKVIVTGKVGFDRNAYNKRYSIMHDRSEYYRNYYRKRKEKRCAENAINAYAEPV